MIPKNIYPLLRNMPGAFRLLLVMVSMLVLLAACGGGSTPGTASATAPATTANTPTVVASTPTPVPTVAQPTPTPTPVQPTPTPVPVQPTPTPAPVQPTPTPAPVQPTPKAPQGSTQIVMIITNSDGSFVFSPTTLTIKRGTTVIWKNVSSAPHTVTSDDGTTYDSGNVAVGASFHFTFTTAGSFRYHCNYHPYMRSTIIVV